MKASARDIRWKLHFRSSPEQLWPLLTTDAGRESFWCERSRQTGNLVKMTFSNGWVENAEVLEISPRKRFALVYFGTRAAFTMRDDGAGGTDLELLHEAIPPEDFEAVLPGWLNVLFPLKGLADFGIDLRNHDSERNWDHGYADG